jgi:phosphoglycolate phosphatase-like HAD superfamily hydrolase
MLRLITDFDGPIMDVSERYYKVYQLCLEETKRPFQQVRLLSKREFWRLKRSQVPERQIGMISGLDEGQAHNFAQLRRQNVHALPYLGYDQLVPGSVEALQQIQNLGIDLVVMTLRRVRELEYALESHSLHSFFPPSQRYCLADDYVKQADVREKPLLMERALRELPPARELWMVGDTEADIVAAKTYQIKVIGVLSGIRNRDRLEHYQPDIIVKDLSDAVKLIASSLSTVQV